MLKVLLADDEDLETHGLVAMLKTFDLPISVCAVARNGKEALEKARTEDPHIVITDLRMPQMDGITLIRAIRQAPPAGDRPQTQCVLISGYEDFHAARAGLELNMAAYLLKPVNRGELHRILTKCCAAWLRDIPAVGRPGEGEPTRLYTPEEVSEARERLFPSGGTPRKDACACAVVAMEICCGAGADMRDHLTAIQAFTKQKNGPAPIMLDDSHALLTVEAPAFLEDSDFLDLLEKYTDELMALFDRAECADYAIGVSDIGRSLGDLPLLRGQGLEALKGRSPDSLARVLFYEARVKARPRRKTEDKLLERIRSIIHNEYASPLSIDIIASRLYLSPSHVRRFFKNKTGMAMMGYVESVRMDKAKTLLSQPQYKIHEIGGLVGYENPSYFNLVFKKYFGITPGEYRQALEQGTD